MEPYLFQTADTACPLPQVLFFVKYSAHRLQRTLQQSIFFAETLMYHVTPEQKCGSLLWLTSRSLQYTAAVIHIFSAKHHVQPLSTVAQVSELSFKERRIRRLVRPGNPTMCGMKSEYSHSLKEHSLL